MKTRKQEERGIYDAIVSMSKLSGNFRICDIPAPYPGIVCEQCKEPKRHINGAHKYLCPGAAMFARINYPAESD